MQSTKMTANLQRLFIASRLWMKSLLYASNTTPSPNDTGEGILMSATCSQPKSTDLQEYLPVQRLNHRLAAPIELSSKQMGKQLTLLEAVPKEGTPMTVTKAR